MEIRFSDYLNNGLVENVKNINNSKHATAKIETPKPQPIKDVWDVLATPFTTTFDLAEDVVSGAARSIEGIVDWGIGVVGSVGGALGANNFEKALADAAKYDFTGNTISKLDDWAEETSLLSYENKVTDIIHSVGAGVGGMLPAIAVSAVTANPAIGTAVFSAGAAGQATQEALNEGASLGRATLYGTLSGATEGAIEYASGALGGLNPFNTGAIKGLFSKGAGKAIMGMIEEGTEEVISDLINPFWKKITYSGKYDMPEFEDMLESFVVGGLTAGVMGGAGQVVNMAKYGVDGNKAQNILNQIGDLNQRQYNLELNGTLTQERMQEFNNERTKLTQEFGELVDKIKNKSEKKYDKFTKNNNIEETINFDSKKAIATDLVNQLNKEFGTDIKTEITDGLTQNGSSNQVDSLFDSNTNTLYINKKSNNNISKVVGSQLAKVLENAGYNKVKNTILNKIGETQLKIERAKIRAIENNGKLTDSQIDDMIVANWLGENITKDYKSVAKALKSEVKSENVITKTLNALKSLKNRANLSENNSVNSELTSVIKSLESALNEVKQNNVPKAQQTATTTNINENVNVAPTNEVNQETKTSEVAPTNEVKEQNQVVTNAEQKAQNETKDNNEKIAAATKEEIKKEETKKETKETKATTKSTKEVIEQTSKQIDNTMPKTNGRFLDVANITENVRETIKSAIENRSKFITNLQTQFTNAWASVEKDIENVIREEYKGKNISQKEIKELVNQKKTEFRAKLEVAIRASNVANVRLMNKLDKIFSKIEAKGEEYLNDFQNYLLHKHNINRMNFKVIDPDVRKKLTDIFNRNELTKEDTDYLLDLNKNGKLKNETLDSVIFDFVSTGQLNRNALGVVLEEISDIEAKPVFGDDVTDVMSKKAVEELLNKHPEFEEYAKEVYDYIEELNKIRLEAGIINQTQLDFMHKAYKGEYVPTYRIDKKGVRIAPLATNKTGVNANLHRAKGGDSTIQAISVSLAQQTMGTIRQSAMNKLFQEVKDKLGGSRFQKVGENKSTRIDIDSEITPDPKSEIYFYEDGTRNTYRTDEAIARAFNSLRGSDSVNVVFKTSGKLVSMLKKLTTEYNMFFAVRNLFRDASDAVIYTKYSPNLLKRYKESLSEIKNKGKYYQLYLENGGMAYSFFDQETGRNKKTGNKLLSSISKINEVIELLPRLSEFMESLKASEGKISSTGHKYTMQERIELAMLDAADVTVNFSRGGTTTKWLNRYLMPYLNAAVQGYCKMYNTFIHPTSARAWCMAMAKMTLLALPTIIFNEIMLGDDDDYKALSDEVKGSYFLIKTGKNKFFRMPRGRVEAVLGDAIQRTIRTARGQENAFKGYAETTLKNVSPVENMTRTILSPITDVKTNVAWHGGKIENASMEKLPLNERYDNNTSVIARALAVLPLGISAKKWHYLLDQYSGVLGDVVLPLTSKDKSSLFKISGLTINNIDNSKYTVDYYDKLEELQQANASSKGDNVDKAKLRYFNKMNTKISELYKEMKEKTDNEEILATKALIVGLQRETLESVDIFGKTLEKYRYGLNDDTFYEDYYLEAMRECFGAEYALSSYNKNVYEKAVKFNKAGIDYDTFYSVYFDSQDIIPDYDEEDKAIPGSKKQKVTNYIKQLNLTATQKYILMGMLGYKNTNGEDSVKSHLMRNGFTGEELTDMMKMCGY